MEIEPVNEMRGAFGIPAELSVAELWALIRGPAREICARAEPRPGRKSPFAGIVGSVRDGWRRAEPPPTHGEAAFLAAICGEFGFDSRRPDDRAERIGRFIYCLLRFVTFSGAFPRITMANLDSLSFSVHLDNVPARSGAGR